jgi:hypothetical protein
MFRLYKAAIIRCWIYARLALIILRCVTLVFFIIHNNIEMIRQYSHDLSDGCLEQPKYVAIYVCCIKELFIDGFFPYCCEITE